jgi:hypothetical protein
MYAWFVPRLLTSCFRFRFRIATAVGGGASYLEVETPRCLDEQSGRRKNTQ